MDLNPGEIICDKCKGTGNRATWKRLPDHGVYINCDKCKGVGKLDWVEAIVGKKSIRVAPGVYVKEVDVSYVLPKDSVTEWKII